MRWLVGPSALWGVLVLPQLWMLGRWAAGAASHGEVAAQSGLWAGLLLVPATLVTPLGLLFPRARWIEWLRRRRLALGAACVAGAALHAAAYLIGRGSPELVLREARQPWILAGWGALAALATFAAVRRAADPRPAPHPAPLPWTRRHRVLHAAAALALLHWALAAFDPLTVQVQTALAAHGYDAGPADGIIGPRSRAALARFQRDSGLEPTGGITPEVLEVLGIVAN